MEAMYITRLEERLKMITMIQSLDSVYVSHINDKARQESENKRKFAKTRK